MITPRSCAVCCAAITTVLLATEHGDAQTATPAPLQLESKIPLGDVSGRIDHLSIDLSRRQLFVAEPGALRAPARGPAHIHKRAEGARDRGGRPFYWQTDGRLAG